MGEPLPSGPPAVEPWVRQMPKAEVHVHLEGTFDLADLLELARQVGVRPPRTGPALLEFGDLADFIEFLDWEGGLVRTAEAAARAAYRLAAREATSGARYADVIVNPAHWAPWRNRLGEFVGALDAGFREAEEDGLTPCALCISVLRDQTASEATELVERLVELDHPRVVALSIDGDEARAGRTGPRFAHAFRRARAAGLRRTVHAGESSGPDGVRDAVDLLGAERLDHGVRAIEDPALLVELADRGIALGVCPTSNIQLGVFPSYRQHPVQQLRNAGVAVSINTDDPALLRTSLEREYAEAGWAHGWTEADYLDVARTSITSSFADPDLIEQMLAELADYEGTWPT